MKGTPQNRKLPRQVQRTLIAAAVFILVELLVLSFHAQQSEYRTENIRVATRVTAEQVVLRIESAIKLRVQALQRLAMLGPVVLSSGTAFSQAADHVIDQFPDFQAVNWINPELIIVNVNPAAGNEGVLGQSLKLHPAQSVRNAIQRSLADDRIHRTDVISLLQGGKGMATYLPVRDNDGGLVGIINGVFRLEELIDAALPEDNLGRQYNFALCNMDNSSIYQCYRDHVDQTSRFKVQLPIQVIDPGWHFEMFPTVAQAEAFRHRLDDALLWISHLLSLLAAFITLVLIRRKDQIKISDEQYHRLFHDSQEGIFILDAQFRLQDANPAALSMFGYERGEVIGQALKHLPVDREELPNLRRLISDNMSINRLETLFTRKNGEQILCRVSGHPRFNEEGQFIGVQGIINDITEHHRTLEQLRQAQKMEAIGELAGGVAHDFNNLLTVITGNAELALLHLGEDTPARVELKEIRATAGRAANLTRQLLAFSRKQVIKPRILNANAVIKDMDRMLRRVIGELVNLQANLYHEAWSIKVDPAQLEQVIVNLAVNARDAMERGGRLDISTSNLTVSHEREFRDIPAGDYLMIEVRDTGCGIPPEQQERIFEPFYTTKPEGAGTGLGLATVYGIVRQSEGFIQLDSVQGRGTTFRIFFPRQMEAPEIEERQPEPDLPRAGGSECLLVVEDEPALRRLIVDSLGRRGFRVLEAMDGQEAVDRLEELKKDVDMIISDVVMPRMGGIECVTHWRNHLPDLPVLFISGYSEAAIEKHGRLQSGSRLLMKPFRLTDLHREVRLMLDSSPIRALINRAV